jgi:hypothetical protein
MSDSHLPDRLEDWPNDPFELLGVSRNVNLTELRRAYTRLIRLYKPEHEPQKFRRIRDAYEALERVARAQAPTVPPEPLPQPPTAPRLVDPNHKPVVIDRPASSPANGDPIHVQSTWPVNTPIVSSRNPPTGAQTPPTARPTPPPQMSRENPRGHVATENTDTLWSRAVRGRAEWANVYQVLSMSAELPPYEETDYCRLYWLLRVAPDLDGLRRPVDWLAQGLSRLALAPRLLALYSEELARRPQEAAAFRSHGLLATNADLGRVVELARARWGALQKISRMHWIADDIESLRELFLFHRPEWIRLLLAAVDRLAWFETPQDREQLDRLASEINDAVDLHLALNAEIGRFEHLLEVAGDVRRCHKFGGQSPSAIIDLAPDLWNEPIDTVRPRLMALLDRWVAQPEQGLANLDAVYKTGPKIVMFYAEKLQPLGAQWPRHDAASGQSAERAIDGLIRSFDWRNYQRRRIDLLRYCMSAGISVDDILGRIYSSREFKPVAGSDVPKWLQADHALKCILAGIRAFWR